MAEYPNVGNYARLTCQFKDEAGNLADPTAVQVLIKPPTGATVTATPAKDSTGVYHYDVLLDQPKNWYYRFVGTGAVVAETGDMLITVIEPRF